jgi:hypothetical protein
MQVGGPTSRCAYAMWSHHYSPPTAATIANAKQNQKDLPLKVESSRREAGPSHTKITKEPQDIKFLPE